MARTAAGSAEICGNAACYDWVCVARMDCAMALAVYAEGAGLINVNAIRAGAEYRFGPA